MPDLGPPGQLTPWASGRDKHEQYREHVTASLDASPWARVVKVSDLIDNAVGLFHTTGPGLPRLAGKYRPLLPVLRELILRPDTPLADEKTSILLHAHPELVRDGYQTADWVADDMRHLLATGMQEYTPSGVIGRPSL